jgi:hypothetical protein
VARAGARRPGDARRNGETSIQGFGRREDAASAGPEDDAEDEGGDFGGEEQDLSGEVDRLVPVSPQLRQIYYVSRHDSRSPLSVAYSGPRPQGRAAPSS